MNTRIADRESDYQRQRIKRMLSPEVTLPFSPHAQRSDPYKDSEPVRGYKEVMKEKLLDEEESRVYKQILEKQQEEEEKAWHNSLVWAAIGGIALVGLVLVKKLRHYVCLLAQNGFARDAYRTDGRDSRKGRRGLTGRQEAEPRVH